MIARFKSASPKHASRIETTSAGRMYRQNNYYDMICIGFVFIRETWDILFSTVLWLIYKAISSYHKAAHFCLDSCRNINWFLGLRRPGLNLWRSSIFISTTEVCVSGFEEIRVISKSWCGVTTQNSEWIVTM